MSRAPLAPGDIIHGYVIGSATTFSRYTCCRVEAVGPDWIVTRDHSNQTALISESLALQLAQEGRDEPCPNKDGCTVTPPLTAYRPEGRHS